MLTVILVIHMLLQQCFRMSLLYTTDMWKFYQIFKLSLFIFFMLFMFLILFILFMVFLLLKLCHDSIFIVSICQLYFINALLNVCLFAFIFVSLIFMFCLSAMFLFSIFIFLLFLFFTFVGILFFYVFYFHHYYSQPPSLFYSKHHLNIQMFMFGYSSLQSEMPFSHWSQ